MVLIEMDQVPTKASGPDPFSILHLRPRSDVESPRLPQVITI